MTMQRLGIEVQTVFGMPPVEHVSLAADLGCGHISTGLTPLPWKFDCFPAWSLRDDASLRREMIAAMRDRGVSISLAEGFAVRPGVEARNRAADLDLMAELGAEQVSSVCMEPDMARALDQFALLADMTAHRDMGFTIEYAPPHPINSLDKALSVIRDIAKPNVRLVIDAMHFFRSGGTLDELALVDPHLIGYAQLCDVPISPADDDYYKEACFERRIPGQGELPLNDLIAMLPADIILGLEIPMRAQAKEGAELRAVVDRAVQAGRHLLSRVKYGA
jgi:sugar phosphate isomerase/epimerase